MLGFATAVSLATGLAVGIVPALIGSRSDPIDAMRGAGRVAGDRGSRLRQTLVSLQVALSLALVACAGLLATSLYNLQRQDFGFRTEGRYTVQLSTALGAVTIERLDAIYRRPVRPSRPHSRRDECRLLAVRPDGREQLDRAAHDRRPRHDRGLVGVLDSRQSRLLRDHRHTPGPRPFPGHARHIHAPPVAVVERNLRGAVLRDGDPIGKRFGFGDRNGGGPREIEIVGVVGDAKYQEARRPAYATFFLPFLQQPSSLIAAQPRSALPSNIARSIHLRVDRPVPGLEADVRAALAEVDPGFTVVNVRELDALVMGNFGTERLMVSLATGFGGMALLLACLGLYGVVTQAVTARTREIGVRMAIGATPRLVVATVLRGAFVQIAAGFVIGSAAALLVGRLLENFLFGVSGRDPRILALSACILGLCAVVAAAIPASRAARIDPIPCPAD